ncbi:MAG TPA: helix-turn-helix transcriptional regulator [Nocardioides sp.]|nr:helix-turn-helix transcriptional regulator [Nocardioides sp.]
MGAKERVETTSGRREALLAFMQVRPAHERCGAIDGRDPHDAAAHEIVRDVLARDRELAASRLAATWTRFVDLAVRARLGQDRTRVAVIANMIALAALGEPDDYRVLDELVRAHGTRRVAVAQQSGAAILGRGSDSLRVGFLLALDSGIRRPRWIDDRQARAELRSLCLGVGAAFLVADAAHADPSVASSSLDDAILHQREASFDEIRAHVARIAEDPWSDETDAALGVVDQVDCADLARAFARVVKEARESVQLSEREVIARSIRALIAESGLTQRAFARRVGTSPSRISSYVQGSVTPSAAMMLRIRRTAALVQAEQAEQAGSAAPDDNSGRPGPDASKLAG